MKCGTKKYAKGGMVKKMAGGGAVMPSRPANFSPQGRGMERARFMRADVPVRPDMPTAVPMAARPFKKGGMVKKMASGGMVKPRGIKSCKVC